MAYERDKPGMLRGFRIWAILKEQLLYYVDCINVDDCAAAIIMLGNPVVPTSIRPLLTVVKTLLIAIMKSKSKMSQSR